MSADIFIYPYPTITANQIFAAIAKDGNDLLGYLAGNSDPQRFVDYYTPEVQAALRHEADLAAGFGGVINNQSSYGSVAPLNTAEPTIVPATPIIPSNTTPTVTGVVTAQDLPVQDYRDGNTRVLLYANGRMDRIDNFYDPLETLRDIAGSATQTLPTTYTPLKSIRSEAQVGDDRLINFADGTQKVLRNYYLPRINNPAYLNNGNYTYGTAQDPEYLAFYGIVADKPWLMDDVREGNDRVKYFSDNTRIPYVNWYISNPGYSPAGTGIAGEHVDFNVIDTGPTNGGRVDLSNYMPQPLPVLGTYPDVSIGTVLPINPNGSPGDPQTLPNDVSGVWNYFPTMPSIPANNDPTFGTNPTVTSGTHATGADKADVVESSSGLGLLAIAAIAIKLLIFS